VGTRAGQVTWGSCSHSWKKGERVSCPVPVSTRAFQRVPLALKWFHKSLSQDLKDFFFFSSDSHINCASLRSEVRARRRGSDLETSALHLVVRPSRPREDEPLKGW
jgi:hypothetical protein